MDQLIRPFKYGRDKEERMPKKAIIACLGNIPENLLPGAEQLIWSPKNRLSTDPPEGINEHGAYDGDGFIISQFTPRNKYSFGYRTCVGMIIAGTTHEGKEVSCMTHTSAHFRRDERNVLDKILRERINFIRNNLTDESIDIVLFGGSVLYNDDGTITPDYLSRNYISQIEYFDFMSDNLLGIRPKIISAPKNESEVIVEKVLKDKTEYYGQRAFYDTLNRRLYLQRTFGKSFSDDTPYQGPAVYEENY